MICSATLHMEDAMAAHFQHESPALLGAGKPYASPVLECIGTIASLTASGSDGNPEQGEPFDDRRQ